MEKKLPGVFPGRVDKESGNNRRVFYSDKKENIKTDISKSKYQKNINQKINEIFNSPNYIYQADVSITLRDKKVTKKLIGKNKNFLITMDNELIPISDVIDIKQD